MGSVFIFQDESALPDPIHSPIDSDEIPIVLDNGSWNARLGWAGEDSPRLIYRNIVAKQRSETLAGNDIRNLDVLRSYSRSPFERNVVVQTEVMETLLDYGLHHLSVDLRNRAFVLTEAPCIPDYCRGTMNELMFERYDVESLLCGIDGLFAGYGHDKSRSDSLNIVLGNSNCHILPVLDGLIQLKGVQRVNLGGNDLIQYLRKLLQLKYPWQAHWITHGRAEEILHNLCTLSEGFYEETLAAVLASGDEGIELRFPLKKISSSEKSRESDVMDAEAKKALALEKKNNQVKRLKEMHMKRLEKRIQDTETEIESIRIEISREDDDSDDEEGALRSRLADLEAQLMRMKEKLARCDGEFGKGASGNKKEVDDEFLEDLRRRRKELLEKKEKIRTHRTEMGKRHSKASRERMRMLWQLAAEDKKTIAGRKRAKMDTFGAKEEDWDVYMVVNKDNWDTEQDVDLELQEVDKVLSQHDEEHKAFLASSSQIVTDDRMFVDTERFRVPEVLFQPAAFTGASFGGLGTGLEACFGAFSEEESARLANSVVVSGSLAKLPKLKERLEFEIRAMRPYLSTFKVEFVEDLTVGAWKGASIFSSDPQNRQYFTTKADYLELGPHYFKEHRCSNRVLPSDTNDQ